MITILYADLTGLDEDVLIEKYLNTVDAAHRGKISTYKPVRSKSLSLAAGILLQTGFRALTAPAGLDSDLFRTADDGIAYLDYDDFLVLYEPVALSYDTGEYGKPSFHDYPQIAFSVSHSQNVAVISIGDEPSGIDVQYHRPSNYMRIADRFFTTEERRFLSLIKSKAGEKTSATVFHDLWAAKEAYVKYTGEGLFRPFDDFNCQLNYNPAAPLSGEVTPDGAQLIFPIAIPHYSFCLCTETEADIRVLRVQLST